MFGFFKRNKKAIIVTEGLIISEGEHNFDIISIPKTNNTDHNSNSSDHKQQQCHQNTDESENHSNQNPYVNSGIIINGGTVRGNIIAAGEGITVNGGDLHVDTEEPQRNGTCKSIKNNTGIIINGGNVQANIISVHGKR